MEIYPRGPRDGSRHSLDEVAFDGPQLDGGLLPDLGPGPSATVRDQEDAVGELGDGVGDYPSFGRREDQHCVNSRPLR